MIPYLSAICLLNTFSRFAVTVLSFDVASGFSLSSNVVSAAEVQMKLEDRDPTKSAGPDSIHPNVLELCSSVLTAHLGNLFNALLSSGIFPSVMKQSFVVAIFKSSDHGSIESYIPIVIQSALDKVYESLVLDYLYTYLRKH